MIITHTRKSATSSNKTLFFNVSNDVITRIFEDGRKEVVTKNERLENLVPLPKVTDDPVEIACEKLEIESIQYLEKSKYKEELYKNIYTPSNKEEEEDYSWILKPVQKHLKNLLKDNAVMVTGIKIEYETIPQRNHIHIEI